MKKKIVTALSLALLTGVVMVSNVGVKTYSANAAVKSSSAEYVSLENAPVIDGVMDEVWWSTEEIVTGQSDPYASGYISILWNETGLYFFASVDDITVNESDRCNFWVSETYLDDELVYSDWVSGSDIVGENLVYPDVEFAWFLCLNPNGNNGLYVPDSFGGRVVDMSNKYTAATTKSSTGYTVELYVPRIGSNELKEGNSIGFDVSIDDYLKKGTSLSDRKSYVNWNGDGAYWENPACLGEVVLVDIDDTNGSPISQEPENGNNGNGGSSSNNQVPENSNNGSTENNSTDADAQEQGCASSVIGLPIALISALSGFVLLKKKKH